MELLETALQRESGAVEYLMPWPPFGHPRFGNYESSGIYLRHKDSEVVAVARARNKLRQEISKNRRGSSTHGNHVLRVGWRKKMFNQI
jgi:predicted 2-oxoglutarate/Fe(II)-dependent dioxygenase YbiX